MKRRVLFVIIFITISLIVFIVSKIFLNSNNTSSALIASDKNNTISYRDAVQFEGQTRTVEMPALYVFNNRKYLFISSRTSPHHAHMVEEGGDKTGFFTVRIFLEDLTKFPPNFEKNIQNKTLLVTGIIGWYQGDPHIVITEPSQITVKE
jgi:hypothetical protein